MKYSLLLILIFISLGANWHGGHTYHVSQHGQYTLVSQLDHILADGDRVEIGAGNYYDHFVLHNNVSYVLDNSASIYYLGHDNIPTISDGGRPVTAAITGGQIDRAYSIKASCALFNGGSHLTLNTIIYNASGDALDIVNAEITSTWLSVWSVTGNAMVVSGSNTVVNVGGSFYSDSANAILFSEGHLTLNRSTFPSNLHSGANHYSIKDNGYAVTVNLTSDCIANAGVSPLTTITGANLIIQ
jgi:hypothetical protein